MSVRGRTNLQSINQPLVALLLHLLIFQVFCPPIAESSSFLYSTCTSSSSSAWVVASPTAAAAAAASATLDARAANPWIALFTTSTWRTTASAAPTATVRIATATNEKPQLGRWQHHLMNEEAANSHLAELLEVQVDNSWPPQLWWLELQ